MGRGFLSGDLPNPFAQARRRPEHVVFGVLGRKVDYHDTPADLYALLAEAFGELESAGVRWVSFGAGNVGLTFWPASGGERDEGPTAAELA